MQGVSVRETFPYGNMQAVYILLECIFVFIFFMKILHPGGTALTSDWLVNGTCIGYLSSCRKNLLNFLQRSMRNKCFKFSQSFLSQARIKNPYGQP